MIVGMAGFAPLSKNLGYVAIFGAGLLLLAFFLIYLGRSSTISGNETDFLVYRNAEALPLDVSLEELDSYRAQWTSVQLPLHWRRQFSEVTTAWYRFDVSRDDLSTLSSAEIQAGGRPQLGLYLWRINQNADFWFNGTKIGSGGQTEPRMARHWNSPLYFSIPAGLIRDSNEVLIKHYAPHTWGSMEPLVIGQESFLQPIYEARYFIQHDISMGLFVFVLSASVSTFAVWYFRREETQYFWFSLGSFSLSFYILHQFLRYLPINPDIWRWLSNVSSDLWAACIFVFCLRSLGVQKPRAEKLVYGYVASGVLVYFYASFFRAYDINIYFHVFSLVIALYSFYICAENFLATQEPRPAFYACLVAVIFAVGVHDIAMQAIVNLDLLERPALSFQNHFNLLHFFAPIIFIFIGASLLKLFVDSMNQTAELNQVLERRVADARQELEANYQAIEKVLVQQSAHEERERIYRDLHDDVGSKLLSLYYRLEDESDSTLARSALEDLRDIVSRKSLESSRLSDAVQQWKREAEDRVQDANLALSWYAEPDLEPMVLSELQHAHLRRMLREVLSNAIIHNKSASAINVSIHTDEEFLIIEVANDGVEQPVSAWAEGRGISNLRIRARDLAGEFSIAECKPSWAEVIWKIPLASIKQESA